MPSQDPDHDTHQPSMRLQIDVAVLKEQVTGVDKKLDTLSADLRDTYARKIDLKMIDDRVSKLQDSIGWVIKLVLGVVIVAVLGLVIVKGGGMPR